ncbi:MAG: response regulator [Candidatus Omnitrophica bacterium]|nr:response regulator [Candidatus Omnitrophota bacterium]MBI3083996.1 response regulator [Candidatus Omnitrophota bacterium]
MPTLQQSVLVMLVEDDDGHCLLIRESLKTSGIAHEIIEMRDGEQALDYLTQRGQYRDPAKSPRPDLILLDIKMPKVDGFTVLEKVKASPKLRAIPVLILTSTDDQAEVNRCYALGANSYVVKPVRYEEFQERIRALGRFLDATRFPDQR